MPFPTAWRWSARRRSRRVASRRMWCRQRRVCNMSGPSNGMPRCGCARPGATARAACAAEACACAALMPSRRTAAGSTAATARPCWWRVRSPRSPHRSASPAWRRVRALLQPATRALPWMRSRRRRAPRPTIAAGSCRAAGWDRSVRGRRRRCSRSPRSPKRLLCLPRCGARSLRASPRARCRMRRRP